MATVSTQQINGRVVISVDLPGLDPASDVKIELREGALALEIRHTEQGRTQHVSQVISIPTGVTADDVQMSRTAGGMEIRISPPGENELPSA
jgi:HSP20 family molecular chaperone IbpA